MPSLTTEHLRVQCGQMTKRTSVQTSCCLVQSTRVYCVGVTKKRNELTPLFHKMALQSRLAGGRSAAGDYLRLKTPSGWILQDTQTRTQTRTQTWNTDTNTDIKHRHEHRHTHLSATSEDNGLSQACSLIIKHEFNHKQRDKETNTPERHSM